MPPRRPLLLASAVLSVLAAGCGDVQVIPFPGGGSSRETCSATESCTIVTLAAGRAQPAALAVDSTHVYWVDRGNKPGTAAILRTLKLGGPVELLAEGQGIVASLALDQDSVYWTNLASEGLDPAFVAVMKVPKAGGAPEALSPVQSNPWGVATGDGQVFWTNLPPDGKPTSEGELWSMPAGGGTATLLASGQKTPISVAQHHGQVFWLDGGIAPGEGSAVMSVPVSGGEPVTLASGSFFPLGLGVDDSGLYFSNNRSEAGLGNVMTVPLDGGEATTLAEGQDHPSSVVPFGDHLYWTNSGSMDQGSVGAVMKLATGASEPTAMVEGDTAHPWGLAVDETHVYWTDGAAGLVQRMDRCCPAK